MMRWGLLVVGATILLSVACRIDAMLLLTLPPELENAEVYLDGKLVSADSGRVRLLVMPPGEHTAEFVLADGASKVIRFNMPNADRSSFLTISEGTGELAIHGLEEPSAPERDAESGSDATPTQ